MACVAQWVGHRPANQKVTSVIGLRQQSPRQKVGAVETQKKTDWGHILKAELKRVQMNYSWVMGERGE